jgi:hypothetical protein
MSANRRRRLAEAQNWRYCFCGCRMSDNPHHAHGATIEHVVPKEHGGPKGHWGNQVASCRRCNQRRQVPKWQLRHLWKLAIDAGAVGEAAP